MNSSSSNTHSRIGASSCERWWNCPGSVYLSEQLPPAKSSVWAEEGTAAHSVCEYILRQLPGSCEAAIGQESTNSLGKKYKVTKKMQKEARKLFVESWIGKEVKPEEFSIAIDAEMIEAAYLYAETVLSDLIANGVGIHQLNVEKSFHLEKIDLHAFGTNDASFITKDKLFIYDYKHGAGVPVEAEGNKQMQYYAVGALDCDFSRVKEIEHVIVQPRAPHLEGPIRRWCISSEELKDFADELKQRVKAVKAVDKNNYLDNLKSGSWCRWCPAKANCSEIKNTALNELKEAYDQQAKVVVYEHTPEQISEILEKLDVIENWVKDFRAHALERACNGAEIPNYKLVEKQGNRTWKDPKDAEITLGLMYSEDEIYERKLLSVAQAEKKLGKDSVEGLFHRPITGKRLVKESSASKKVKADRLTAAEDFADYDNYDF